MRTLGTNAAILMMALLLFLGLYELFPEPGWVDPGMYTGYAINPDVYKIYPMQIFNYQGSRLGFILPLHYFSTLFEPMIGRLLYVIISYVEYGVAVFYLTSCFLRKNAGRILLNIFFLINPIFISSILFGSADGPAAVQLVVAVAFLVGATQARVPMHKKLLSLVSGAFFALAVSSQIAAAITALFIVCSMIYTYRSKISLGFLMLGGIAAIALLASVGFSWGLHKLYLSFSLGYAHSSFNGSGAQFTLPFNLWIRNSIYWLPVILCALLAFVDRRETLGERELARVQWAARLNLIAPLVFCIAFDYGIGANLLGTPTYFNIFFPSFLLGAILLFAQRAGDTPPSGAVSRIYAPKPFMTLLIILNLIMGFTSKHLQPEFAYNAVHSRDCYRSQIAFKDRITSAGLGGGKIQFVFRSLDPNGKYDPRNYYDVFNGSPRVFDYIDTLAALYLWDQSIAARIEPNTDLAKLKPDFKDDRPLILLGRNNDEVQQLAGTFSRFLGGYSRGETQCYSDEYYPWCFITYKK
jgi:hypothetical protein